jgi:hypothetical protein
LIEDRRQFQREQMRAKAALRSAQFPRGES